MDLPHRASKRRKVGTDRSSQEAEANGAINHDDSSTDSDASTNIPLTTTDTTKPTDQNHANNCDDSSTESEASSDIQNKDAKPAEPSIPRHAINHDDSSTESEASVNIQSAEKNTAVLASLSRAITPPPPSNSGRGTPLNEQQVSHREFSGKEVCNNVSTQPGKETKIVPSPFRLTRVRDLPDAQNVGTVSLGEILGDPMIREAWLFDFLFDLDFVM